MGRIVLAVLFVAAGLLHFLKPGMYVKIMPPFLSGPLGLVYASGAAEMLGGIGLLVPATRVMAAWGLVALLICVWPANLYMAMRPEVFPGIPVWALWVRLPLQIPMILWAWKYTRS
jgi:uncharacterized membrane protein